MPKKSAKRSRAAAGLADAASSIAVTGAAHHQQQQQQSVVPYVDEKLNYWNPTQFQLAINSERLITYYPLTQPQPGAPIEITGVTGPGIFLDLDASKIEIEMRIIKADGTDLGAADDGHVGPVNNIGHSMWSNIEFMINGRTVTEAGILYPVKALICHKLSHSPESLTTKGVVTCGYKSDTEGTASMDNASSANDGPNAGLVERAKLFRRSKKVTMSIHPYVDVFSMKQYFPDNSSFTIRLYPAANNFALITDNAENYKIDVKSVKFIARSLEVNTGVMLAHSKMLAQTHALRIPYQKLSYSARIIPQNVTNHTMNALYQSQLPHRVLVMLVNNEHINGTYASNPHHYRNFNLRTISMKIDGEEYPREGYKMDFENDNYTDAYNKVLEGLGFDVENIGIDLTPTSWAKGFTFFVFKLSPGPLNGVGSRTRVGNSLLSMTFAAATPVPINCIMFSDYDNVLEIDEQKNVLIV
jgi:hypothetical protein